MNWNLHRKLQGFRTIFLHSKLKLESIGRIDWNEAEAVDHLRIVHFYLQKWSRRKFLRLCGRSEQARKSDFCQLAQVDLHHCRHKLLSCCRNLWSHREFSSLTSHLHRSLKRNRSYQSMNFCCICRRVCWFFCSLFAATSSEWAWIFFAIDILAIWLVFEHWRCSRWCYWRSSCCIHSRMMTFWIHFLHWIFSSLFSS